jgi:hypothetical protein
MIDFSQMRANILSNLKKLNARKQKSEKTKIGENKCS